MSDNKCKENLASYIMRKVLSNCTGENVNKIYDDKPSKKFFVGTLNPKTSEQQTVFSKVSPSQMGISGLVDKEKVVNAVVKIKISGVFYQRVFPNYKEQLEVAQSRYLPLSEEEEEIEKESENIEEIINIEEKFREVYQKTERLNCVIERKLKDIVKPGKRLEFDLLELKQAVDNIKIRANNNKHVFLHIKKLKNKKVPPETLESELEYNEFINKIDGAIIIPEWDLKCRIITSPFRGKIKMTAMLENAVEEEGESKDLENSFFEANLEMEVLGTSFKPYILEQLGGDYKFDGNIEANGINCSIEKPKENIIRSSHTPVFIQHRYKSISKLSTKFKNLIENPIEELKKIEKEMRDHQSKLDELYIQKKVGLTENEKLLLKKDIEEFKISTDRFGYGIEILKKKDLVGRNALEAFKLMNQSFSLSSKGFDSWYLFQIVFITSLIPDIASVHDPGIKNYRDYVDLIYFPTGGGKTEAYLGVVIMQIFFDRFMGKTAGVSAITRFPLRLLSLQQLQRIADIFAQAEIIRRRHPIIGKPEYDCFSTGYFVGGNNTPNKINSDILDDMEKDEAEGERFRIIAKCPFCQSKDSVEININKEKIRIEHICKNDNCPETVLPIYISDYEIYRYLPTFIIGTIDKSATCGLQRLFRHIFGQVSHVCPIHGYLSGGRCLQYKNCAITENEYQPVNLFDPTPSLLIQDELHLIRESLGSYNSHYESFFDEYMKRLTDGKKGLKIIGATATIQQFSHQINHLYSRPSLLFPPPDPNLKESFFAYENDEVARLIIGIMPHNKTIIFAVLDILRFFYEEIKSLLKNPEVLTDPNIGFSSIEEAKDILDNYRIMLSYNLVKREGDAITQSVKTMLNPRFREKGIEELSVRTMTGDVTFRDVKEVLRMIEDKKTEEKVDLITATSMISHGIDLDALNFMVFRGMPRSTAEYIQAYSRVGRKYPGIVFLVFNHIRERDQSYYKYFQKFHEFQSLLVEPVPINRWAKFSIDRTLPGVFSAAILNYYGFKAPEMGVRDMHMAGYFAKAYSERKITESELKNFIHNSYKSENAGLAYHFKLTIEEKIEEYVENILDKKDSHGLDAYIPNTLSDPPMRSLRDTDIPVEVTPTGKSYDPMLKVSSMRTRGGD